MRERSGPAAEPNPLTDLLRAWSGGDEGSFAALVPLVYDHLHERAAQYLRRERGHHTLQPTALVHEAFVRLMQEKKVSWQGRGHFYGVAAVIMRRILVDHARTRGRAKRGGSWCRIPLSEDLATTRSVDVDLLDLDHALAELGVRDPRQARLVELRFFAGLSIDETAAALGVSSATSKREWDLARAWLYRRVRPGTPGDAATV